MASNRIPALFCVLLLTAEVGAKSECGGIEGHVMLGASRPLGNVSVSAGSRSMNLYFESTSDLSGYYALNEIPAGRYSMFADAKAFGCILILRVVVHQGERVRQDFHFERFGKKEGCEAGEK